MTTSGERKREKFSQIEYQCWKNYSKERLVCELKKINFDVISVGTAQQLCDKLDHKPQKIVDLLTPTVIKTIRNDRHEASYITVEKKKLKNLHKRGKKTKNFNLMRKCRVLEKKIKSLVLKFKKNKVLELRQILEQTIFIKLLKKLKKKFNHLIQNKCNTQMSNY